MTDKILITSPVGRIVQGDVYRGNANDQDGKPNIFKSGSQMGQPYNNYFIALAVPKSIDQPTNTYVPWENEPWGQQIMQVARTTNPGSFDPTTGLLLAGRPMAYKVNDGDSNIPNQNQKRPCDQEGFPGCWILSFSHNGNAGPRTSHMVNGAPVELTEQIIKRGHYAEIRAYLSGNADHRNPGVFFEQTIVNHRGYGEEIFGGPDIASSGFGQSPVPVGASEMPLASAAVVPAQVQQAAPAPLQQAAPAPLQQAAPAQQYPLAQAAPIQGNPIATAPPLQQAAPAQVVPATDLVQQAAPPLQQAAPPLQQAAVVEESYMISGNSYTRSQVLATPGYTEASLATLQRI